MAHTFDTSGTVIGSTATSISLSYTTSVSASALVLSLSVNGNIARTGGAPTYNGVTMVQAGTTLASGGNVAQHEMWVLTTDIGLTQGTTANIVIPNAGAIIITVVASSYISATGRSLWTLTAQASGNSINPTVTLTATGIGCALVSGVCGSIGALTAARTLLVTGLSTIRYGGEYFLQTAAGNAAMNWTATTGRWATHAILLTEVPVSSKSMMGVGI